MKILKKIAFVCALAGLMLPTLSSADEKTWEPLFPIPTELPSLPLIEKVLFAVPLADPIDQEQERQTVGAEAERLMADAANLPPAKLKELFYRQAALLAYDAKDAAGQSEKFSALRENASAIAKKYFALAKGEERKIVNYYIIAHSFLDGHFGDVVAATLKKRDLPRDDAYLNRLILMRGLADLDAARSRGALKRILDVAKKFSPEEMIPAYLAVARSYAGMNATGHHVQQPSKAYKGYLAKAGTFAVMQNDAAKSAILNYTIVILQETEGQKLWDKFPLPAGAFQQLPEWSTLEEGNALALLGKGKTVEAVALYAKMGERNKDAAMRVKIDERILDILQAQSGNAEAFDTALHEMDKKYRALAANPNEKSEVRDAATRLHQRYKTLVTDNIEQCLDADPNKDNECQRAVTLATNYQTATTDKEEVTAIKVKVAEIYQHIGDHKNAVKVLLALAKGAKGGDAEKYLRSAADSQRTLASWPETTPWDRQPLSKANPELTALIKIYEQLLAKKANWEDAAQLSLASYVNGDKATAFKIWEDWLLKSPGEYGMDVAAGIMLTSHYKERKWSEVVRLAHIFQEKRIDPELKKEPINLKQYLADGLFGGSIAALKSKDYKQATSFLEEFVKDYPQDKRHAQALYTLGQAYHSAGDDQKSIVNMKVFIDTYPQDKLVTTALVNGISWSKHDKMSIFFHEKFIQDFYEDQRVPGLRDNLIKLYMKTGLYGPAARSNKAKSLDERTSDDEKFAAAWQYLTIEDKYGDMKQALWGATRIIELSKGETPALADALGLLARYSNKYTKYDKLEFFEKMIENFEFRDPHVKKNLAQVRLLIAKRNAAKPLPEIQNIALKKPATTLQERFNYFKKLRADFMKVCAVSSDEICDNAKFELSTVSERVYEHINVIKMPSTLGEKLVAPFNTKKNTFLQEIRKSIIKDSIAGK